MYAHRLTYHNSNIIEMNSTIFYMLTFIFIYTINQKYIQYMGYVNCTKVKILAVNIARRHVSSLIICGCGVILSLT